MEHSTINYDIEVEKWSYVQLLILYLAHRLTSNICPKEKGRKTNVGYSCQEQNLERYGQDSNIMRRRPCISFSKTERKFIAERRILCFGEELVINLGNSWNSLCMSSKNCGSPMSKIDRDIIKNSSKMQNKLNEYDSASDKKIVYIWALISLNGEDRFLQLIA